MWPVLTPQTYTSQLVVSSSDASISRAAPRTVDNADTAEPHPSPRTTINKASNASDHKCRWAMSSSESMAAKRFQYSGTKPHSR